MSPYGPTYYREQAKAARELGDRTEMPDIKEQLLEVARQYDALAEHAEKRARGK